MASVEFVPLPLPASADASKFANFGREVRGLDPGNLTPETFKLIEEALYKVGFPCTPFCEQNVLAHDTGSVTVVVV